MSAALIPRNQAINKLFIMLVTIRSYNMINVTIQNQMFQENLNLSILIKIQKEHGKLYGSILRLIFIVQMK